MTQAGVSPLITLKEGTDMTTLASRATRKAATVHIPAGAVAHLVIEHLCDLLGRADAVLTRERFNDETFSKEDSYRVLAQEPLTVTIKRFLADLENFARRFQDQNGLVEAFTQTAQQVLVSTSLS